jgi:hypothetical protein
MTTRSIRMGLLAAVASMVVAAGSVEAAPITYTFQSGQIRVEASTGGAVLGLSDVETLDGFQVTLDTDALGAGGGGLTSMELTSDGPVSFTLDPSYAEYDFMSLSDITLSGSGDLNLLVSGPPDVYTYLANPLELSATLDADDFEDVATDLSGVAISSVTDATGFITLDTIDAVTTGLFMQGVTIGQIDLGDGSDPLVLKADFVFVGEGVIPEPNGAWLMGVGVALVGLAGLGRYRSIAA